METTSHSSISYATNVPEHTWPRLGLRVTVLAGLLAGLIAVFLLSLMLGLVRIPLGGQPERATWATIVLNFRLPRALTATLAGAALAVSGLQMQTLFRNPLADPYSESTVKLTRK